MANIVYADADGQKVVGVDLTESDINGFKEMLVRLDGKCEVSERDIIAYVSGRFPLLYVVLTNSSPIDDGALAHALNGMRKSSKLTMRETIDKVFDTLNSEHEFKRTMMLGLLMSYAKD